MGGIVRSAMPEGNPDLPVNLPSEGGRPGFSDLRTVADNADTGFRQTVYNAGKAVVS
jgi:hypothetical protein